MKKDIEYIIVEMINKVKEEGRKPSEIKITQAQHDQLAKKLDLYSSAGYEVVPTGVVYHPTKWCIR